MRIVRLYSPSGDQDRIRAALESGEELAVDAQIVAEFGLCVGLELDDEALEILRRGENPVWFDGLELSVTTEESIAINTDERPKVIISASGMCDAGRIRHHLKHNLWDPKNTILFVGYQTVGTPGHSLLHGAKKLKLFGETIAVNAQISSLHGTSGHADQQGLLDWVKGFTACPGTVFVNHGDEGACETFAELLRTTFPAAEVIAPFSGTEYDLLEGKILYAAEGRRIEKQKQEKQNPLFESLKALAQKLLTLVESMSGRSNNELKAAAQEIKAVIDKHQL